MTRAKVNALRVLAKFHNVPHLDYISYKLEGKRIKRYLSPRAKCVTIPHAASRVRYGWDKENLHWELTWGIPTRMSRDARWVRMINIYRRSKGKT